MALNYKTPTQVGDDYLQVLKSQRPDVNIDQTDTDWWIRSRTTGGVISGVYADQKKIAGDIFPQSARSEAVDRHLATYGLDARRDAQQANGTVSVTGDPGTYYEVGTSFEHEETGNTYLSTEDLTIPASGSTGAIPVESVAAGQNQNLLTGTALILTSPPAGSQPGATVQEMADGRDRETVAEAAQRVLDRIQAPIQGGTESDYRQWAIEADGSVTSAEVVRFPYGLGTVGVFITAGTTDIDTALENGDPIVRVPSSILIDLVQDYIYERKPLTDCVDVFGGVEASQDVTVRVKYREGLTGSSVLAGQTRTLDEMVELEVKRALYKIPIGGRKIGPSGYVIASEIEEVIDLGLSDSPYTEGIYAQILVDRQVDDLSASGANRGVLPNEIVVPGTITVVEL